MPPAPKIDAQEADWRSQEGERFLIVGIGASAGGLEAFERFLGRLSPDSGLAYVLVQHLSPEHESSLADILSRATTLPVTTREGSGSASSATTCTSSHRDRACSSRTAPCASSRRSGSAAACW